jgi:hypothetical protein
MSQLTRREILAAGTAMAASRTAAGTDTPDPRHTRSYNGFLSQKCNCT